MRTIPFSKPVIIVAAISVLMVALTANSPESQSSERVAIATVTKVTGPSFRYLPDSVRAQPVSEGLVLLAQDVVSTLSSSHVVMELVDGSTLVLDGGARIRFRSPGEFHQERGVAYYDITRRATGREQPVRIQTDFAIVGVKGTEFIVNAEPFSAAVSLSTGELEIESVDDEPFEFVERQKQDSFDNFRRQRMGDFNEWRRQLVEEFIQYKRSFTLEAGKQVRFNGRRVTEDAFTDDEEQSFARFRQMR